MDDVAPSPYAVARPPRELNLRAILWLIAVQNAAFAALGALLWHWSGRDSAIFVTFALHEWLLGIGLGAGFILAAAALFYGLPHLSERLVRLQGETYRFLGPRLGWPAIVAISLAAGIGEEALLRGGVQTLLGDRIWAPTAIAISSAIFAGLHLGKPVITALLFVIGLAFGVVYWVTGSLLVVMIGHVLYDIWALRYLHREFVRLGIVGDPLANPADPG